MKLTDLFETFYMKEMNGVQKKALEMDLARLKDMSFTERRTEFKTFGKLGRVSADQIIHHRVFGTNKHDWGFSAQYPGKSEQKCYECGKTRMVSDKGTVLYR